MKIIFGFILFFGSISGFGQNASEERDFRYILIDDFEVKFTRREDGGLKVTAPAAERKEMADAMNLLRGLCEFHVVGPTSSEFLEALDLQLTVDTLTVQNLDPAATRLVSKFPNVRILEIRETKEMDLKDLPVLRKCEYLDLDIAAVSDRQINVLLSSFPCLKALILRNESELSPMSIEKIRSDRVWDYLHIGKSLKKGDWRKLIIHRGNDTSQP